MITMNYLPKSLTSYLRFATTSLLRGRANFVPQLRTSPSIQGPCSHPYRFGWALAVPPNLHSRRNARTAPDVAIIGGETHRFRPLVDLYREAGKEAGYLPEQLKVGMHSLGYVADTTNKRWMIFTRVMQRP